MSPRARKSAKKPEPPKARLPLPKKVSRPHRDDRLEEERLACRKARSRSNCEEEQRGDRRDEPQD